MKKIFALFLVLAMCLSVLPTTVFAQDVKALEDESIHFSYEAESYQADQTDYINLEINLNVDTDIARFWGIDLYIDFDKDLILNSVDGCLLNEIGFTNIDVANNKNAVKITQDMYPSSDIILEKGAYTFVTLKFEVSKFAIDGKFDFIVNSDECTFARGMFDEFENELLVDYGTGTSITLSHLENFIGDVNSDSEINNKDLGLLIQYINGWDVEINTQAAEINGDDAINNKDYALLMRHINGWDVEI